MKSFVTGAHAYGETDFNTPVDIVIPASKSVVKALEKKCRESNQLSCSTRLYDLDQIRVIAIVDAKEWKTWTRATKELMTYNKQNGPVDVDIAVECFEKIRQEIYPGTTKCKACQGKTISSKGGECFPCKGTGRIERKK